MIRNHITYTPFSEWRFKLTKAKGSYIWDQEGKKYIDFTSGWNVTNLGWNHPEINQAMTNQINQNTYAPMWASDSTQETYAKQLIQHLPELLTVVNRVTGGVEANEHAIKLARTYTGRKKIAGFIESFHGSSLNMLGIAYRPEWQEKLQDKRTDLIQLNYPEKYRTDHDAKTLLDKLEQHLEKILIQEDVAALITEAGIITGWGSTWVAPLGFLSLIRKMTQKYGTLLILDEVGTGFSRTGKLFGFEHDEVVPDIITLAKGLTNGAAAAGAMVTTEKIAEEGSAAANLQSTFGWTPVACAAMQKTLEIHVRDRVWEQAKKQGDYLLNTLRKELAHHELVGDIRGMGLEIGIDIVKDKKTKEKYPEKVESIVTHAFENGLHLVSDHESNIQMMPPLTISRSDLDKGLEILIDTIN